MIRHPDRRERDAVAFQSFIREYGRRARRGADPNDRQYDRTLQGRVRRMSAAQLDALLRHGEDDEPA